MACGQIDRKIFPTMLVITASGLFGKYRLCMWVKDPHRPLSFLPAQFAPNGDSHAQE